MRLTDVMMEHLFLEHPCFVHKSIFLNDTYDRFPLLAKAPGLCKLDWVKGFKSVRVK